VSADGTTVATKFWFGGGKSCEEVRCDAGFGTLDCVSIEDEKSSSLNDRCEVFLMTGARTCFVFGGASGTDTGAGAETAGAGWPERVVRFAPGTTVAVLEGAVVADFAAAGGGGGVFGA
jgi:hypothetical protein